MKNPAADHHASFITLVERLLGDKDLAVFILSWLQLPPNLSYLADGLQRTATILTNHQLLIEKRVPALGDVPLLADKLQQIAQHTDELQRTIGPEALWPMGRTRPDDRHPLTKYCLSVSPFWAGQFYTLDDPDESDAPYDDLFAEVAICLWAITTRVDPWAYQEWIGQWRTEGQVPTNRPGILSAHGSRMQKAAYAVRLLTNHRYRLLYRHLAYPQYGADLPERTYRALELGKAWWRERDREHDDELWIRLDQIALLLSTAIPGWTRPGESRPRQLKKARPGRTRRTHQGDGHIRLAHSDWLIEQVTTDDDTHFEIYQVCLDQPESLDDDPALEDYLDAPDLIGVEQGADAGQDGLAVRTARAAGQTRQLAKHYLLLRHAYNVPTTHEWRCLRDNVRAAARGGGPTTRTHLLIAGACALGRAVEEIAKTRIARRSEPRKDAIEYLVDQRCWRIQVTGPDLLGPESLPTDDTLDLSRAVPVSHDLYLPDYAGFGAILERLDTPLEPGDMIAPRLTHKRKEHVHTLMNAWLDDDRIGVAALHKPLYRALVSEAGGDLAPATMLTGQAHAHARTTLHYALYGETELRGLYARASQMLWGDMTTQAPELPPPREDRHFGNPTHPRPWAVQGLIEYFQDHLTEIDPVTDLAAYNDSYVLYTVVLATLAQAWRPTVSPAYHAADAVTQATTWTDKARTEAHRRGAFLPPMLHTHLTYYVGHLRAMAAYCEDCRRLQADGHRFILLGDPASSNASGHVAQARAFRPKNFRQATADVFGLPLYSLRRYTRMALLRDYGVSGETVDALMGHGRVGLMPFETLATYPASALQQMAETEMQQLLSSLGARPIRSRLVTYA